jgi:carbamoyl-phosphate synthase small subunit
MKKNAKLTLTDGSAFNGYFFGHEQNVIGEVVFNTSINGYQEILTDPSYCQQIINMTFPLMGNYGIGDQFFESKKIWANALIVSQWSEQTYHWNHQTNLDHFLKKQNVTGLAGIDTRALTQRIREHGTMKGAITSIDCSPLEINKLLGQPLPTNEVELVSTKEIQTFYPQSNNISYKIGLIDFGYKKNILYELLKRSCIVHVFPHNISYENLMTHSLDGLVFSNGPGDPKCAKPGIDLIKKVQGKIPFLGICLGHQLFGLANGANTEKMSFGHRGGNHAVKNLLTNKIYLSSQNHSYEVTDLNQTKLKPLYLNVNDNTLEGLISLEDKAFSVQFHPEARPGPEDTSFIFDEFLAMLKK